MMKLLLLSVLIACSYSAEFNFPFDSDLEGWVPNGGLWYWANRQMIPNILPSGVEDGFAVFDQDNDSDDLYWHKIDGPYGAQVTFRFFASSQGEGTNSFELRKTYDSIANAVTIQDFSSYVLPDSREFQTLNVNLDPETEPYYIAFYCFNSQQAAVGSWFQGCVIDSIDVVSFSATTTPEITTPEPTTPEPTTPEPTTPEPTTPEPTTPEPTTPEPTTPEPTTPEPTTPEPTTQRSSTLYPPGSRGFNFQNGMEGWTLSHTNGAYWIRSFLNVTDPDPEIPSAGPFVLQVKPAEQYSATTLAQSPYFEATESLILVRVKFWMEGTDQFPCQLKVRKRSGIDSFGDTAVVNLDSFGNAAASSWITQEGIGAVSTGERFVLILEGSLGGDNVNKLFVSEIYIEGVKEIPLPDSGLYDFEDGLVGFSSGNMDGARWYSMDWNLGGFQDDIPPPIDGHMILTVEKFDTHSGIATIETPPMNVTQGSNMEVSFKYWTRGSVVYPVALRMRVKTNGGLYQAEPFLNLIDNGNVVHDFWISYTHEYSIILPEGTEYLQLVVEADMGASANNMLALDDLSILTVNE